MATPTLTKEDVEILCWEIDEFVAWVERTRAAMGDEWDKSL